MIFEGEVRLSDEAESSNLNTGVLRGSFRVWFRGFLSNHEELREILHVSDTDSESTLVAAYIEWGATFQSRLRGEYAYAFLSYPLQTLILGHDALGIVPIFYRSNLGTISFSSHLSRLASGRSLAELNEEWIADYLAGCTTETNGTPFRGIQSVAAGTAVMFSVLSVKEIRTHSWIDETLGDSALKPEFNEEFRYLVSEAIDLYMPASGVVLCELSGGLDSTTVAAACTNHDSRRVRALSLVNPTETGGDQPWIERALRSLELTPVAIDIEKHLPFSQLPTSFLGMPSKSLFISGLHQRLCDVFRDEQASVIMTGHGGDAVFMGDGPEPFFLADLIKKPSKVLFSQLQLWSENSSEQRPIPHMFLKYGIMPLYHRVRKRRVVQGLRQQPGWISSRYASRISFEERRTQKIYRSHLSMGASYFWERVEHTVRSLSQDLYQQTDERQYRCPLLHLPLVEFMAKVPSIIKLTPDYDRPLQRSALKGLLPEVIRRRAGKASAEHAFVHGFTKGVSWQELLLSNPLIAQRGYVEPALWERAVKLAAHGHIPDSGAFFAACALEVWLRAFN